MKKNWKYSLLLIAAVFALAMGVFFLFYRFDNKYTARGDQAIQGILYVSDDDSVHYLAREWEYYPDVLLTPQEIKEQKEDYYSRYVSIGEYGGMDMGDKNKSPFGSGTYRMTLVLPEKEKQYAIGLTEIFSAYKLYINGELMGQMGNPDPDNYQEQIQNRVFTFEGKETAEIVIAVTDKHSVSSGIQYVPVLASPFKVNIIRGLSLMIAVVFMAFTFFHSLHTISCLGHGISFKVCIFFNNIANLVFIVYNQNMIHTISSRRDFLFEFSLTQICDIFLNIGKCFTDFSKYLLFFRLFSLQRECSLLSYH